MNTYIAKIETTSGTQTIKLAAANIHEAQGQVRSLTAVNSSYSYVLTDASPTSSPEFYKEMAGASGALLACLILFAVCDCLLRKWLRG